MLALNEKGLQNRAEWERKGYQLPAYDRSAMIEKTRSAPAWIHFGAGNIFRAFQCNAVQRMLNDGHMNTGIIAVEGFDYEIVEKGYRGNDNYTLLVTLKADGSVEKTVIGSIAESCILDRENAVEYGRLAEIFTNPSLQMASFTITEKGYAIRPAVEADFANGPQKPQSYIGKVASLLYARYQAGGAPIAMVSMDNCSHNGDKLKAAITAFAEGWKDEGFLAYVSGGKVSFPWTMIDKITPRPDASVEAMLRKDGLEGLEPIVTSRHTYIAPFVNAEESEYLVIEDDFPNGRPALEKAGFIFTDRDTVNKVERMKVCTCLNPLHTALAVTGCLLGYTRISDEMKDADLVALIHRIGYAEGLPVVTDPGVIKPREFIDTVVNVRLPNPFMPDTPQRIACDTSQKIPIRFGETVKCYLADPARDVSSLEAIPLAMAAWLRYLLGVDDQGNPMEVSPDPLLPQLQEALAGIALGDPASAEGKLDALLGRADLFGVSLIEAGLDGKVKAFFAEMLTGPGAVRNALHNHLA
ncbi:MAG: mannitol dehydrogenase family protein [Clostridia bacterium]|nr:mannitol dehydrogenase family protein [Clostridia bacterium]